MNNHRVRNNFSGRPPGGGRSNRTNSGGSRGFGPQQSRRNQQYRQQNDSYRHNTPMQGIEGRAGGAEGSRPRRHTEPMEVDQPAPMELPGFYYDPVTRKHYAIAGENSGISGFTQRDITTADNHRHLIQQISANREERKKRPAVRALSMLSNKAQLGLMNSKQVQRTVFESRLMSVKAAPSSTFDVRNPFYSGRIGGCTHLAASKEGTALFGSWNVHKEQGKGEHSFNTCMRVVIDEAVRERALREQDNRDSEEEGFPLNTMGLTLDWSQQYAEVCAPEVVDIKISDVDSEVTSCLYVSASADYKNNQLRSRCECVMYPLPEWSAPTNYENLNSPIYNIFWDLKEHVWSCGWSSRKMQISLGHEGFAKIVDIISDQHFKISSQGRSVLSQEFSPEGNLIYMGLQGKDVICSDLRMPSKHIVAHFKHTTNSCFVHALESTYDHHVVTQGFNGKLSLWDTRQTKRSLLDFGGHTNAAFRLPCVVEQDERFLFAVGADGCTRGWSLHSGELLCELATPHPGRLGFPRVAYSDSWGGRYGNCGLLIAAGDSLYMHQLDF